MLNSFIDLIFPKTCYSCRGALSEEVPHICLMCRNELAKHHTLFLYNNPVEKLFWGRLPLQKATSFLRFEKRGAVQQLLHALKYKGVSDTGLILGELAALELQKTAFFDDIDLLLPVPIHAKKQRKRGYNQSQLIAQGIANITQIPINTNAVVKKVNTTSQTYKTRFNRYRNASHSFQLMNKTPISNKHVLLVDDVLTTGSTVEALGKELKDISGVQLSLLTIAYTY